MPETSATPQATTPVPKVLDAIVHVMQDMAKEGVAKGSTNVSQNFKYRGIDEVMDALSPSLARHQLLIVPHVRARAMEQRESRNGGTLFHCTLEIEYDFIACADGSKLIIGPIFGEAMDSGDKATNKAMATAYKYACTQTFCIPFSGDDPDAQSHEVAGAQTSAAPSHAEPKSSVGATAASARPATPAPATPIAEVPMGADGKPRVMRKGGNFGYGKTHAEKPWDLMKRRDLEWFMAPERTTPLSVRQNIAVELAWRDWEEREYVQATEAKRKADDDSIMNDDIP